MSYTKTTVMLGVKEWRWEFDQNELESAVRAHIAAHENDPKFLHDYSLKFDWDEEYDAEHDEPTGRPFLRVIKAKEITRNPEVAP